MRVVIVYDSVYGNTAAVAKAIADELGQTGDVELREVPNAEPIDARGLDLLVVGGPTHRHGVSERLRDYLERIERGSLTAVPAATFDTRYRMSALLSGSAAGRVGASLRRAGCRVEATESFFIVRDRPPDGEKRRHQLEALEPGELDRARAWARGLKPHAAAETRP